MLPSIAASPSCPPRRPRPSLSCLHLVRLWSKDRPLSSCAAGMPEFTVTGCRVPCSSIRAMTSAISGWRGTGTVLPFSGLCQIEWLPPSRFREQPWRRRCFSRAALHRSSEICMRFITPLESRGSPLYRLRSPRARRPLCEPLGATGRRPGSSRGLPLGFCPGCARRGSRAQRLPTSRRQYARRWRSASPCSVFSLPLVLDQFTGLDLERFRQFPYSGRVRRLALLDAVDGVPVHAGYFAQVRNRHDPAPAQLLQSLHAHFHAS